MKYPIYELLNESEEVSLIRNVTVEIEKSDSESSNVCLPISALRFVFLAYIVPC